VVLGLPHPFRARPFRIGFEFPGMASVGQCIPVRPRSFRSMWDAYTVEAPYVIRENRQYRCVLGRRAFPPPNIGYATSADGVTWTKPVGNPVLSAGTSAWEAGSVGLPCVMAGPRRPTECGTQGRPLPCSTGRLCIGLAHRPDGISWQKDTKHITRSASRECRLVG